MGLRWSADSGAMDWSGFPTFYELPGHVVALQPSALAGQTWALCEIRRKWWQF